MSIKYYKELWTKINENQIPIYIILWTSHKPYYIKQIILNSNQSFPKEMTIMYEDTVGNTIISQVNTSKSILILKTMPAFITY